MACARVERCPLFKQFAMKSSLTIWKTFYCEGSFAQCERFRLSSAGQTVPGNLLPNGRLLEVPMEHLAPEHMRR